MKREQILKPQEKNLEKWKKEEVFSKIEGLLEEKKQFEESIQSAKVDEANGMIDGIVYLNLINSENQIIRGSVSEQSSNLEFKEKLLEKLKSYIAALPQEEYTPEYISFEYKIPSKDPKKYGGYVDTSRRNLLI